MGKEVLNDPDVKKEECQYHYRKSCKRNLVKVFHECVAWIAKKRQRNREMKRLLKKRFMLDILLERIKINWLLIILIKY